MLVLLFHIFFSFQFGLGLVRIAMQRKFKKRWSTSSHLKLLNTKKKHTITYDLGNPDPDLRYAQKCGGLTGYLAFKTS